MIDIEPGIYPESEQYFEWRAVNRSALCKGLNGDGIPASVLPVAHELANPSNEETDAMRLGTLFHMATLEPAKYADSVACWDGGRRAGKDWAAFKESAESEGRSVVTADERDQLAAWANAARRHETADKLLWSREGPAEVGYVWDDAATGLRCKCKLDKVTPGLVISDIKTSRDPDLHDFGRAMVRYGYDMQAAMYLDGYRACTGDTEAAFVFVVVGKSAPYEVIVCRPTEGVLNVGRERYREVLRRLRKFYETGETFGYAEGVVLAELPDWFLKRWEESRKGFE